MSSFVESILFAKVNFNVSYNKGMVKIQGNGSVIRLRCFYVVVSSSVEDVWLMIDRLLPPFMNEPGVAR